MPLRPSFTFPRPWEWPPWISIYHHTITDREVDLAVLCSSVHITNSAITHAPTFAAGMISGRFIRALTVNQKLLVRTTRTSTTSSSPRLWTVTEFPASEQGAKPSKDGKSIIYKRAAVYAPDKETLAWEKVEPNGQTAPASTSMQDYLFTNVISHFLPAQYPQSVQPEYAKFTSFCFAASVAGSAGMVLSTQTLLLAVGVVGSHQVHTAGVMAGALNWVLKDGKNSVGETNGSVGTPWHPWPQCGPSRATA